MEGEKTVGVRELKQSAAKLVREAKGRSVIITVGGRPVARLEACDKPDVSPSRLQARREFMERAEVLAARVAEKWPSGPSAAETVAEGRD